LPQIKRQAEADVGTFSEKQGAVGLLRSVGLHSFIRSWKEHYMKWLLVDCMAVIKSLFSQVDATRTAI